MSIYCCSSQAFLKKYNPHTHDQWEIICQLEGEVRSVIDDRVYTLTPGDLLLIPPGAMRRGSSREGFRDLALRADNLQFPSAAHLRDTTGDITALLFMIERVLTERRGDFQSVTEALVLSVGRMIRQELGYSCSPEVEAFKILLYENLSNPEFSLSDALRETGYHTDHFRRCFKREVGKTPLQYLISLRLERAHQLLSEEHRFSIEAIASACGFSDVYYFSKAFKKCVGLSPLAYRDSLHS